MQGLPSIEEILRITPPGILYTGRVLVLAPNGERGWYCFWVDHDQQCAERDTTDEDEYA